MAVQPLSLDGFSDELVITRADMAGAGGSSFQPISMAFLPDNRMLLLSKTGQIRIVDPESGANSVLMNLPNINSGNERGLLDITLDPDFDDERPLLPLLHAGKPAARPDRPLHPPGEFRRADLEGQPVERGRDLGGH